MIKIKNNKPIFIFLAVCGLLLFLHGIRVLRPVENFLISLVRPLSSRLYNWGTAVSHSYGADQDIASLQSQVDKLAGEVALLTVANSRCLEIDNENKKLRDILVFKNSSNFRLLLASVIAKEASIEDSRDLIINRGREDGLSVGLGVISESGEIVGKIVEVKDNMSKICLTTSPNCQFAASVQNQSRTQGITDGDLGLTIKMTYIPQLEKISPNDLIITSGLGEMIPRGLVIGKVTQVKNESNEVWQAATIEPLTNFDNLTIVSVVIP